MATPTPRDPVRRSPRTYPVRHALAAPLDDDGTPMRGQIGYSREAGMLVAERPGAYGRRGATGASTRAARVQSRRDRAAARANRAAR